MPDVRAFLRPCRPGSSTECPRRRVRSWRHPPRGGCRIFRRWPAWSDPYPQYTPEKVAWRKNPARRTFMRLKSSGGDERDVVVLLVRTVPAHVGDDGGEQIAGRKRAVATEGIDQALFAEFFERGIERLGDAVGVKDEGVARLQLALADFAVPLLKGAEDGGRGMQGFDPGICPKHEAAQVAAIRIADAAGSVVILGEKERGEGSVGRVFEEKPVDSAQQTQRIIAVDGALAAQIRLEIGHKERGGNAFSGNVADDEAQAIVDEAEEIVVVAPNLAGLLADAGVVERRELREILRKQARLHALGDFEFLGGTLLGFEAPLVLAALGFDAAGYFVEADQGEKIAVGIPEAAEGAAPDGIGLLGREFSGARFVRQNAPAALQALQAGCAGEFHSAAAPFAELAHHIFGDEGKVSVAADELVVGGVAFGSGQGEMRFAVGRREHGPGAARAVAGVEDQLESEGVHVEVDAALEITDKDGGGLQAEEGRVRRGVREFRHLLRARHGGYYKAPGSIWASFFSWP